MTVILPLIRKFLTIIYRENGVKHLASNAHMTIKNCGKASVVLYP
jgi:hypothetical protein